MSVPRPDTFHPNCYGSRPGEWDIVEEIIAMRRDGLASRRIAMNLNGRGIPTRRRRLWHPLTVLAIIERFAPELASTDLTIPQQNKPVAVPQSEATAYWRDQQRKATHRASARA